MKFSSACVSAVLSSAAVTARLLVVNRFDVHSEPNRISNIDGSFEYNNSNNEGATALHPTTDIADYDSSKKEECSPPVTVSKINKIDAGNLPLSSCSSSKKQICIITNVMKSSSSTEKKHGVCTGIHDVPIAYWGTEIPASYLEDTVSTAIPTGNTTTVPKEVSSKMSIFDNNSSSQLSDVEEQLDHYQRQQHQLQQLDGRHLAEADCTCSTGRPEIKKDGADFSGLITD
jgi:hypothetical protein